MRVTIICDASYCPQQNVAGYGYWIASDRGKKGGGGQVVAAVLDNNTAEMMAVCNTLWHGIKNGLIQAGDEILIQTDCLSAIDRLGETKPATREQDKQVLEYFRKVTLDHNLKISWRHVKGHTNHADARFAANRKCDQRAKQHMRLARVEKIGKHVKELLDEPVDTSGT